MGGNMTPKEIGQRKTHGTFTKMLDVLEEGPLSFEDLANRIGMGKSYIRVRVHDLVKLGCVSLKMRRKFMGGGRSEYIATLVDRSKYIYEPPKVEEVDDEPEELTPHIIQSPTNPHCTIYMNLNRPARKEDLRKLNTGWMGYTSGLEML
jgi:predicted transcriptional regulator